jgi:asparaginyl-tRNA synthetase
LKPIADPYLAGNNMREKCLVGLQDLTPLKKLPVEMPKPLEEVSEVEIERKQRVGTVTTEALKYLTNKFANSGFKWLLPVVLSQSTDPLWPDCDASIEKRVETEIYGKTVRMTTSMIVHKLVACSLAYPKLFIISPNVRIERRERAATGIHAYEFTQLDFEARNASSAEIRSFVESLVCGLMAHLKRQTCGELLHLNVDTRSKTPRPPFKVYDKERLELEYGKEWASRIVHEHAAPFWVTNIPREFYDFEDDESGKWDNYDLFLPGYGEVLSGARREFEYDKIVWKMEKNGVGKENYAVLLKLAKEERLKPTAGAGIGIERLVSWIVEAKHVGDVQLFPRVPGSVYEL